MSTQFAVAPSASAAKARASLLCVFAPPRSQCRAGPCAVVVERQRARQARLRHDISGTGAASARRLAARTARDMLLAIGVLARGPELPRWRLDSTLLPWLCPWTLRLSRNECEDAGHMAAVVGLSWKPSAAARRLSAAMLRWRCWSS